MQENITPPLKSADDEVINLLDYLEIIARRWRLIAKVTAAACVFSIALAFLLPKKYESTAKILPPQQDQSLMAGFLGQMGGSGLAGLAGGLLGASTPVDTFAAILDSEDIKNVIIDRFKLMEVYDKDTRVEMYKKMEKIIDISAGKKDGIISINVEDEDPKRAAAIAETYVDELGKLMAKISITDAAVNRSFLEVRLAKAKADLARAEESLKQFQTRTKAFDVPQQAKGTIEGIAMLQAQLVVQETQLAAVRSHFTDTAQEVLDLKATIASMQRKIAQMEGKGSGSSIIPTGSVPQLGQEYIRLMREFKIQEAIVDLLTKQYELAKLTEAKNVSSIQVVQKPNVADKKSKPKRLVIIAALSFLGLFGSVLFAFFEDYMKKMAPEDACRWRALLKLKDAAH